jgi:hypothetical protein
MVSFAIMLAVGVAALIVLGSPAAATYTRRYTGQAGRLTPAIYPEEFRTDAKRFAPGTYPAGTVVGQNATLTAANDVQTITITGTPTGGTFRLQDPTSALVTAAIAYNAAAAAVQTALEALYGTGNVAVTGGPGPGTPWVATFQNAAGGMPQAAMTVYASALTGGASPAVAVAHTTTGRIVGGTWAAYNDANSDGTQVAKGVLEYALTVDNNGFHKAGGGEFGSRQLSAPVVIKGYVRTADLTGLDAAAIADLGRIVMGDAANLTNTGTILKIN